MYDKKNNWFFESYNKIGDNMNNSKTKSFLFICFLILLFFVGKADAYSKSADLPLLHRVIFVDPGHGGRDPGTSFGSILEKDLNLSIALALKEELGKKGAIVYLTREDDIDHSSKWDPRKKRGDLYRRIQMIEKEKSDLFLSIHINWYQQSYWSGAEVLYSNINLNNKLLAESIMHYFNQDLKSKRHITTTDLYMYNNTKIPGVLIECGFLSNAKERNLLQQTSYQKKLGKLITKGVIDYLDQVSTTS